MKALQLACSACPLVLALIFLNFSSFAQSPAFQCGTGELHKRLLTENPAVQAAHEAFEQFILQQTARTTNDSTAAAARFLLAPYTLPVVVHIVHQNGPENLSDAQVETTIEHLNEAFSHGGYFGQQGLGEDVMIRFCLARQTPDGLPTNGITRTESPLTDVVIETQDLALKKLDLWDPTRYINIWVVRDINSTAIGPNVGGYAFLPAAHGLPYDGIVILADGLGSEPRRVSNLAHEMGHYLGLYHTFEGGCQNTNCLTDGDRVCDTPPDRATGSACNFNSCTTDADDVSANNPLATDVDDYTWNLMDYSPSVCYSGFTAGQVVRMRMSVESARMSLLQSKGCVEPCPVVLKAGFEVSGGNNLVVGDLLAVTNTSVGATQFQWFENGTLFSSSAVPAGFQLPGTGIRTLMLVAGNGDARCMDTMRVMISVRCNITGGIVASDTTPAVGQLVIFTAQSQGATDFSWTVDGVAASNSGSFSQTFTENGYVTVGLTASNGYCSLTQTLTLAVGEVCPRYFLHQYGEGVLSTKLRLRGSSPTVDGGLFLYGFYTNQIGAALIKSLPAGQVEWKRVYPNIYSINSVQLALDGGYIVSGFTNSSLSIGFVMKCGLDGVPVWCRSIPNVKLALMIIEPMLDGGFYLIIRRSTGAGNYVVEVSRIDKDGNIVWQRNQISSDQVIEAKRTNDDGLVIARGDGMLFKLDQTGSVVFAKKYWLGSAGTALEFSDNRHTIAVSGNDIYLIGQNSKTYLWKTDSQGDVQWAKKTDTLSFTQLMALPAGVMVANPSNLLARVNPDGNVAWARDIFPSVDWRQTMNLNLFQMQGANAGRFVCWNQKNITWAPLIAFMADVETGLTNACVNATFISLPVADTTIISFSQTLTFNPGGSTMEPYAITMIADTALVTIQPMCSESSLCKEDCTNQKDDDGDGYVDCFDSDCPCFTPVLCSAVSPVNDPLSGKIAWRSSTDGVSVVGVPLVGDLNPSMDTMPEIIVPAAPAHFSEPGSKLLIFSGDGSNADAPDELLIPGGFQAFPMAHPTIADLDGDGRAEIILACSDSLVRIFTDYQRGVNPPMKLWAVSDQKLPFIGLRINPADFDHDGVSELYSGNLVFWLDFVQPSAPVVRTIGLGTGSLYGQLVSIGQQYAVNNTIAADLLPNIGQNGTPVMETVCDRTFCTVEKTPLGLGIINWPFEGAAGYTTSADINLDGRLDFLSHHVSILPNNFYVGFGSYPVPSSISSSEGFWIENIPVNKAGAICVANVFNNHWVGKILDLPEVLFTTSTNLYAFNFNKTTNAYGGTPTWKLPIQNDTTAIAPTAFDFNGDGYEEIVLHDQAQLRVLYGGPAPFPPGVDADRNWFSIPAPSLPFDNYAVVADVDGDLEADIVYTTYDSETDKTTPGDRRGRLVVVKSAGQPWYPARQVWNQFNYLPVAINDDLTVPRQQQAHQLPLPLPTSNGHPLNKCLAQLPLFDSLYQPVRPLADVSLRVDSARCAAAGDSVRIWITVCNVGDKPVATGLPVSFYTADPTLANANLLYTVSIPGRLMAHQCRSFALLMPAVFNQTLFAVANDDGQTPRPFNLGASFPATFGKECGYVDNITSFSIPYTESQLDLGPDLKLCSSSTVTLNAGPGFASYRWNDGSQASNYTAYSPGLYWVEALDGCGKTYSDTVRITLDPLSDFQLSPIIAICAGDSVQLSIGNSAFVTIGWSPASGLRCTDCANPMASPVVTTTYTVTAANNECIVTDTVRVEVQTLSLELLPQNPTCNTPGSIIPQTVSNGPFQFKWSDGSSGNTLANLPPGDYALTITNVHGCTDSDTTMLILVAPENATIVIDSVHCYGQPGGQLHVGPVQSGLPPFEYRLDNRPFTTDSVFENLLAGTYLLTVRDANGCTWTTTATVPQPSVFTVTLTGDTLAIPGKPLMLTATVQPPTTALQQITWSPAELFPNPNQLVQSLVLQQPALIIVLVTNEHDCPASDSLAVESDKTRFVFFPNILASGGSTQAENGRFTAYGSEAVAQVRSLRVFSRWGELIFERFNFAASDPALGWDGTSKGRPLPPGVFIWTAEVEFTDGSRKVFEGEVTVLR